MSRGGGEGVGARSSKHARRASDTRWSRRRLPADRRANQRAGLGAGGVGGAGGASMGAGVGGVEVGMQMQRWGAMCRVEANTSMVMEAMNEGCACGRTHPQVMPMGEPYVPRSCVLRTEHGLVYTVSAECMCRAQSAACTCVRPVRCGTARHATRRVWTGSDRKVWHKRSSRFGSARLGSTGLGLSACTIEGGQGREGKRVGCA